MSMYAKPKMRSPSHKPLRSQVPEIAENGRSNARSKEEWSTPNFVFYALVHGVTQEIDYLRKCEEEPWRVPNRRTTRVSVVGCVSEYDTQHRGTNTAARFEVVKVLWDKAADGCWTQLLILLL